MNGASIEGNNTSVVVMLLYEGVLFVCPGDIEPPGWHVRWDSHRLAEIEFTCSTARTPAV